MFTGVAQARKTPLVPFFLEPIAADRANFQDDNLHPTAATQPRLLDFVWPHVRALM
jgi:acyl-CoA thioesterase I